ncbi:MAG: hypothetical protein HC784_17945 [Hydrococcus sp. CSU_1_8]|nr:hypothetical protein [Hydrococcus sp. CSU_1_8]
MDIIVGGKGNDLLIGSEENDQIKGGDGNDTLQGLAGEDTLMERKATTFCEEEMTSDRACGVVTVTIFLSAIKVAMSFTAAMATIA